MPNEIIKLHSGSQSGDDIIAVVEEISKAVARPKAGEVPYLRRLFPDPAERARRQYELAGIENEEERKLRTYKMLSEGRVANAESRLNAWLKTQDMRIQHAVATELFNTLKDLKTNLHDQLMDFAGTMAKQKAQAEALGDDDFKKPLLAQIRKDFGGFITVCDKLVTNFESIVDKKIEAPKSVQN